MARYTLSKTERLSSLKAISQLFDTGSSLAVTPIRLVWLSVPQSPVDPGIQVMFSVPKKKFPRAVDRNRIKRLLREGYRLRKPMLYERLAEGRHYHLAILFTGNDMPDYALIQKSLHVALDRWLTKIASPTSTPKA